METMEYGLGVTTEISKDGCLALVKRLGKTVKRYKGETAHMDAARLARDIYTELLYRD